MSNLAHKLKQAAEVIDSEGNVGEGSNSQAEFDATAHVVPGYYPDDISHFIGVDVDSKWVHSASLSVQYQLTQHGLLTNSFHRDEFTGYADDETHIEHDYIFHVVSRSWLPDGVNHE